MSESHDDDAELLTADEVCALGKFSKRHLQHLEARNDGPPFVKLGRLRRYPRGLYRRWIAAKVTTPAPKAHRRPSPASADALFVE